jgi:hypothetical protein
MKVEVVGLAPWELENGFDERGQKLLLSRGQWRRLHGRIVIVPDSEAKRTVTSRQTNHLLCLFSADQTAEPY